MIGFPELLRRLVAALDGANVPFMIAGSFASTAHGLPRATQDLDIVIDPPNPAALEALLGCFPADEYYVDSDTARDALRRRAMFNVIDNETGWKIDFILRKNRPFSQEEFRRRQALTLLGVPVFVASAEDTIIAKLEWSLQGGGSERQRRDIVGILETAGPSIDIAYVERWVRDLGLETEWHAVRANG
jgi:hypothetical protein